MAVAISGYFDDGRTGDMLWTLAGYLAERQDWEDFGSFWSMTMDTHGVPYLHIKEFADPDRPQPAKRPGESAISLGVRERHRNMRAKGLWVVCQHTPIFVIDYQDAAIERSQQPWQFSISPFRRGQRITRLAAHMSDLQRFNGEKGLNIEPYPLAWTTFNVAHS